jgi:hypothetical protein
LRLDKLLKDAEQAEKDYQDFKLSKDAKETALNQNAIKRKQAYLKRLINGQTLETGVFQAVLTL